MLATMTDYKQRLTLIQDSGIQFLDFALTPLLPATPVNSYVRKSANGPLLRVLHDARTEKFLLPSVNGMPPEVVKPELSIALEQSLKLLDKIWLPLPFFRFNPPRTFIGGAGQLGANADSGA